jgi:tetratricopeptide (TPR) repeat protein
MAAFLLQMPDDAVVMAQGQTLVPQAPGSEPKQHDVEQLLDRLFGQLHKAQDEEAAKAVEHAIWQLWAKSGSPSADLLLQQATRAMNANSYPTAIRILDTIIEIKPDFPEAWNKRATVYFLDRQFEKSLADIDVVLDLEPRHFGALSGLGMIKREMGDESGALRAYRRALAIHPCQEGAKRAVKELESEFEQKI